ncbi:MAG: hypothetical protein A3F13_09400 [Gammaproteobacteria bacterium RIFCSPHIGHO2_12_FULL_40_19]|nr:MAG: hypothetical protein A3F13_09400 [Gammaproteobacteria bacterium RIFCSPHIGHO2_12_FULL_40_19]
MINIIIVLRKSLIQTHCSFPHSIFSRINEPFDFLKEKKLISYSLVDEQEITLQKNSCDLIIFSKHVSDVSVCIAESAKQLGIKIIYDLDDLILNFPKYSTMHLTETQKINFYHHMTLANIVTISTPYLQKVIKKYIDRETHCIFNGFNLERHYNPQQHSDTFCNPLKIVYTNADKLKLHTFRNGFFDTINRFLNKNNECVLEVISDHEEDPKKFSRFHYLGAMNWFEHKKLLMNANYYLGIVPLGAEEDDAEFEFNACKSNIKYLEYGGLKIAGIYSKNPVYTEVIENRYNGLLVENTEEAWTAALEELFQNKQLHRTIVENAHRDVKENHSVSKSSKLWMEVFQKVMESGH